MEHWSNIFVRKANIIYSAENFYCAGIVMSEALGKFQNTPPRVTDDVRARRHEPQTAAEKLSHNIAKRWRMDGTRAHIENGSRAVKRQKCPDDGFSYVSLVAGERIPVLTGSSSAPVQNISI